MKKCLIATAASAALLLATNGVSANPIPEAPAPRVEDPRLASQEWLYAHPDFHWDVGARQQGTFELEVGFQLGEDDNRAMPAAAIGVLTNFYAPPAPSGMRVLRFGASALLGNVGDARHAWFSGQLAYRPSLEFWSSGVFALSTGPRVALTVSPLRGPGDVGIVISHGPEFTFGLLDKGLSLNIAGDALFAVGSEFRPATLEGAGPVAGTRVKPRLEFSVQVDFCALLGGQNFKSGGYCRHPVPVVEPADLTPLLMHKLATLKPAQIGEAGAKALCAAADRGVALPAPRKTSRPQEQPPVEDEVLAFGEALRAELAPNQAEELSALHDDLLRCVERNRWDAMQAARAAAADAKTGISRDARKPNWRMQYAPYLPELRSGLGCEPDATTGSAGGRLPKPALTRAALHEACEACPSGCRDVVKETIKGMLR